MILWAKLHGGSGGFTCGLSFSCGQVSAGAEMSQNVCFGEYGWKAGPQLVSSRVARFRGLQKQKRSCQAWNWNIIILL